MSRELSKREKARRYDSQLIIEKFNELYPVGSKCPMRSTNHKSYEYKEEVVKHEAFMSNSGDPVAFFEGKSGYYAIEEGFVKYPE